MASAWLASTRAVIIIIIIIMWLVQWTWSFPPATCRFCARR